MWFYNAGCRLNSRRELNSAPDIFRRREALISQAQKRFPFRTRCGAMSAPSPLLPKSPNKNIPTLRHLNFFGRAASERCVSGLRSCASRLSGRSGKGRTVPFIQSIIEIVAGGRQRRGTFSATAGECLVNTCRAA